MRTAKYYLKRLWPFAGLFIAAGIFNFGYKALSVLGEADFRAYSLLKMLLLFIGQSASVFLFAATGFALYLLALPQRWHGGRLDRFISGGLFFCFAYLLLFSKLSEALFWNEFGVSFNFIAVDYLVYTQEILGNICESYPLGAIFGGITAIAGGFTYWFWLWQKRQVYIWPMLPVWKERLTVVLGLLVFCILSTILLDGSMANQVSPNRYSQEIAKNEMYSFFSAFMNNRLEYDAFYIKHEPDYNLKLLRKIYQADNVSFFSDDSLRRQILGGQEKPLNVMFVVMESMGSEFMNENRTDGADITPYLSRLAKEGLYFPNTYAVGTRTVRGLEAVTLALPPQAGMSVIRQKENGGLFNIGDVFTQKGYDVKWIYGGYGYFDNMNTFYGGNGFEVIDRTAIDEQLIHHETIWGIADEDLFTKALTEADQSYESGRKFFQLVMTTSNHRPYTYPEGRIDLPTGESGRLGAVKYADWAIGDFVVRAKEKPWFKDTVFVFIADHGASSAGKQELNSNQHKIPFIIYAPQHIVPQRIEKIISQIDAAPTLLGLLQFSYTTSFMGRDACSAPDDGRYFISNYQYLGYGEQDELLVLKPVGEMAYYEGGEKRILSDDAFLDKAVAYYQYAADWMDILREKE